MNYEVDLMLGDEIKDLVGLKVTFSGAPANIKKLMTTLHIYSVLSIGKWQLSLTRRREQV